MNTGFGSRSAIGVMPAGGPGRRLLRDVYRLVTLRSRLFDDYGAYPSERGHALLWLLPWNGEVSLAPKSLDLFYIEICRRVRLRKQKTVIWTNCGQGVRPRRLDSGALIAARHQPLEGVLDERQRCLHAAVRAKVLGHGGVKRVSVATGVARGSILAGIKELASPQRESPLRWTAPIDADRSAFHDHERIIRHRQLGESGPVCPRRHAVFWLHRATRTSWVHDSVHRASRQ